MVPSTRETRALAVEGFIILYSGVAIILFFTFVVYQILPKMFKEIHIKVEESKAETLISFLKELDFVKIEKQAKKKPLKNVVKIIKTAHLPFFALCTDWEIEAEILRKSGWSKRGEEW